MRRVHIEAARAAAAAEEAAAAAAAAKIFTVRKNVLSDQSVIWEIWQAGSEQRLASAADEVQAGKLAAVLNAALHLWAAKTPYNTVDAS